MAIPPISQPIESVTPETAIESDALRRANARLQREKRARAEAELLLENKSRELYEANQALMQSARELERRVAERTQQLSEERAHALQMAETDALTGLSNRIAFERAGIEAMNADHGTAAVVLIDLDKFKEVNDSHGHAAGDQLLIEVAIRLRSMVRPGDRVARLGGDEFAVLAARIARHEEAGQLGERLLRALNKPIPINGHFITSGCSIGIAMAQEVSWEHLLRNADLALYEAKRAGGGRLAWYNPALRELLDHRAAHDAEIRQAVVNDQIEPWYQPVFRHSDQRFVGAEMLARRRQPDGTVCLPGEFIESVESQGLLDIMMANMLRRALSELAPLVDGGRFEYLSINVSPTQFSKGWILSRLPLLLRESGFSPSALVIEITENAALADYKHARGILSTLKDLGVRVAIDDFGIQHSNFRILPQLPIDILKLDLSLVRDMTNDPAVEAIAGCIIGLAHRLNLKVIAEGVETPAQADLLAQAGCTAMQGFLYAHPQRDISRWFTVSP